MSNKFTLPSKDPTSSPLVSVSYNDQWTPFIIGALENLLFGETFEGDDQIGDGLIIELILIFAAASEV